MAVSQIFMKYGRQRWKLKGKIEVNGRQSWDGEETVFLPLIAGLISIKVQSAQPPWSPGPRGVGHGWLSGWATPGECGSHMWEPRRRGAGLAESPGSSCCPVPDICCDSESSAGRVLPVCPLCSSASPPLSPRSQRSKGWPPTCWWAA